MTMMTMWFSSISLFSLFSLRWLLVRHHIHSNKGVLDMKLQECFTLCITKRQIKELVKLVNLVIWQVCMFHFQANSAYNVKHFVPIVTPFDKESFCLWEVDRECTVVTGDEAMKPANNTPKRYHHFSHGVFTSNLRWQFNSCNIAIWDSISGSGVISTSFLLSTRFCLSTLLFYRSDTYTEIKQANLYAVAYHPLSRVIITKNRQFHVVYI